MYIVKNDYFLSISFLQHKILNIFNQVLKAKPNVTHSRRNQFVVELNLWHILRPYLNSIRFIKSIDE